MYATKNVKKKVGSSMIVLSCLLLSCSGTHQPQDLSKGYANETYKLGKVIHKNISSVIQLPGELKPFEELKIYSKVNGFVKDVLVDRGSMVHRGETLITLEAPEIEQQLEAAKEKYIQSQELFQASKERYDRLMNANKNQGTISATDMESAKAKMNGDEALMNAEKSNVAALNTLMGYLTITAPFDGVISERNIHPGAFVGPNAKMDAPLLMLEEEQKLRLTVYIPESFTGKVDYKKQVFFKSNSFPGKQFTGMITRSAGALNTNMRAEAVELDVDTKDRGLKPGMYAEVIIPLISDAASFEVPSSAIVASTERKYLISLLNNKTKFINILEGIKSNDSTEIFGDLHDDQIILLNGSNEIKENQLIQSSVTN